jgi:hypothetical protein
MSAAPTPEAGSSGPEAIPSLPTGGTAQAGPAGAYALLGVPVGATAAQLDAALAAKARTLHPSTVGDLSGTPAFRAAVQAFETLNDPGRRKVHDAELAAGSGQAALAPSRYATTDDVGLWNVVQAHYGGFGLPVVERPGLGPDAAKVRNRRNLTIGLALAGFFVLVFVITLAHLGRYALARPF